MAQSLACVIVHIVFSTKGRKRRIDPNIRDELFKYMGGVCNALDCPIIKVGGFDDHVHVACFLSRTNDLASFIAKIKIKSSKWIKTKGPSYRGFAWQGGYSVFSVGRSQLDALVQYITNQEVHHRRMSFQEELLSLLDRYQVEYDQRYLWD